MRTIRRFVAVTTAVAWVALTAQPAVADEVTISDAGGAVTGLAYDSTSSRLFAVSEADGTSIIVTDDQGQNAGTISYGGSPESVQGLAFHDGQLYVGDIGDADAQRRQITVYRMAPNVGDASYQAYDFAYPDGARDAKALLVSGKGRIYVVTAGDNPGVYRADLDPSRSSVNQLERAADAPPGVTDAVFLSDGSTIVYRTAAGVQSVNAYEWEDLATVTYVGAPEGESLTSFREGRILVGAGPALRDEEVPTQDGTITIGSEPSASPSGEPTAAESSPAPEESSEGDVGSTSAKRPRGGGLKLALGAAGVLALTCGGLVLLRRR
ncbi:MAG: hypothetical protein Q4D79_01365 [Propionibacteriaceae bacterium]|nr:hypothetical protein [Propionibacteriaceae bacterium]